jgi:hypothetical protein
MCKPHVACGYFLEKKQMPKITLSSGRTAEISHQQIQRIEDGFNALIIHNSIVGGSRPERRVGDERRANPYVRRDGADPRSGRERRCPNTKIKPLLTYPDKKLNV